VFFWSVTGTKRNKSFTKTGVTNVCNV